jgi:hypothetical protein
MLTIETIRQILDEHEVFLREPQARSEHLDRALFAMGVQRAELRDQVPRLDDGVFVSWAICLPFHKQPRSYSELMQTRRADGFTSCHLTLSTKGRECSSRPNFSASISISWRAWLRPTTPLCASGRISGRSRTAPPPRLPRQGISAGFPPKLRWPREKRWSVKVTRSPTSIC